MKVISLRYKYGYYGLRIPLFFIAALCNLFVVLWIVNWNTAFSEVNILNISIWFGLFIAFLTTAIVLCAKYAKPKRLAKKGQHGFFGEIVVTKKDDGSEKVKLYPRSLEFYYQLPDGRIGLTAQRIENETYKKLDQRTCNTVPIVIKGTQAVLDEEAILNQPLPTEELHFNEEVAVPVDKNFYGRLLVGVIWFAITLIALFIPAIFIAFSAQWYSSGGPTLAYATVLYVANPFIPLFLIIGSLKITNYYYVRKIKEKGITQDKKGTKMMGTLIPLVNTKEENERFCFGNNVAFVFKGRDGKYHQTKQLIAKKYRKKIDESHNNQVQIYVWRNRAVIDENAILDEEEGYIKKIMKVVNKYRLIFFAALAVNIYFLVSELIDVISAGFKSGLSNFGAIVYIMSIVYMCIMEFLDWRDKKPFYGYAVTVVYLALNIAILPGLYIFSGLNDNVAFITIVNSVYGTALTSLLTTIIYIFYLFLRFLIKIIKSRQAMALGEHYNRCQNFGEIISCFYTFLVFVSHILIITIYMTVNGESATISSISFQDSVIVQVFFAVILAAMSILDIILLIKCAKIMRKGFRDLHSEEIEEIEELTLLTPRLVLNNLKEKDEETLISILKNPQVNATYMVPVLRNKKDEEKLFIRLKELCDSDKQIAYGIYFEKKIIGFIHSVNVNKDEVEVGYFIEPELWNKGFATEALSALITELFDRGYNKITASHFEENLASGRVMEKCGMKKLDKTENIEYHDGKHKLICYEISK